MEDNVEMITITKEVYDELIDNALWLRALESMGLDNWVGVDMAIDLYEEWKENK